MNGKEWKKKLYPYTLATKELMLKFRQLSDEYLMTMGTSPIESVRGRVKTVNSIEEKMKKKGIELCDLEERMEDLAGVRIIVPFVEDIVKIRNIICKRTDLRIKSEKDYVSHPKESGYRSYHMIVFYTVQLMGRPKELQVEIQIRTLAMNFWATIDHSLQYKYKDTIPMDVQKKLKEASDTICTLDSLMSEAKEEIQMHSTLDGEVEV